MFYTMTWSGRGVKNAAAGALSSKTWASLRSKTWRPGCATPIVAHATRPGIAPITSAIGRPISPTPSATGPVYHAENLRRLVEYLLLHPCVDCGEPDPIVLEFDHRDRSTKGTTVANIMRYSAWSQVEAEIRKCDVRCANRHRRRTARQMGWGKVALAMLPHNLDGTGGRN